MVVIYHFVAHRFPWLSAPHTHIVRAFTWRLNVWAANAGSVGVDIFFVISGYLITKLLLEEEAERGRISLTAFYVRRTARIWPAMLVYVAATVVLGFASVRQSLPALSFACNTEWLTCHEPYGQFWSLAVEEQFYLVWPALLILAGRFRFSAAAVIAGVSMAVGLMPSTRVHGWINNAFDISCLSAGILCALSPAFKRAFAIRVPAWILATLLIVVVPFSMTRWIPLWPLALLVLPPLIVATVIAREAKVYEPLRQIGLVSYSLYLWQGLATQPFYPDLLSSLLSPLAIPVAWLSYRHVERPVIKLGHRLSSRLTLRKSPGDVDLAVTRQTQSS